MSGFIPQSKLALWSLLLRPALLIALAGLLGSLFGYPFAALFFATLVCLLWHLGHLYQLDRWLQNDLGAMPNAADRFWANIYYRFAVLDHRSRKRKRKLNRIIKRFRTGVAALPDAAVVLNRDHQVEWCNRASQRLLGLRPSHDIGLPITTLVRNPGFTRFLNRKVAVDAPDNDGASIDLPSPVNADIQLSIRLTPFGKKQRLLLATDVSAALRLERMRRDFVANASHELRTPLTVIIGYLEALLGGIELEDAAAGENVAGNRPKHWQPPLSQMQEQAHRMLHIVEDLMLLSRLETDAPPAPKAVAVSALLATIIKDAKLLSENRYAVHAAIDTELWLKGAERELHSAFSNLIFNAVRHTPPGTQITIRWFADQHGLHLSVEDNGPGIAPQHLARLSERFYRVDRGRQRDASAALGGTGLGLAIVKHVMQRHKGQLSIDSHIGIGSVFSCHFPASQRAPAPPAAATADRGATAV